MPPKAINQVKQPIKTNALQPKKPTLSFSQQVTNLQKKIQQMQERNNLILKKIHKAYDFKKKKIYYEAPGMEGDQQEEYQQQGDFQGSIVEEERQHVNQPRRRTEHAPRQELGYNQQQFSRNLTSQTLNPQTNQQPYSTQQQYIQNGQYQQNLQRQRSRPNSTTPQSMYQQQQMQQFSINAQSQQQYPVQPLPQLQIYSPSMTPRLQHPNYTFAPVPSQQVQTQQYATQSEEELHDLQQSASLPYNIQEESLSEDIEFKSNTNFSDIQKGNRATQGAKRNNIIVAGNRRDLSDIRSSYEERTNSKNQTGKKRRHTPKKKSLVYRDFSNNSLYSQGNNQSEENGERIQSQDLEVIEGPITVQNPLTSKRPNARTNQQFPQQAKGFQQPRYMIHSTGQLYNAQYIYANKNPNLNSTNIAQIPISPVSNPQQLPYLPSPPQLIHSVIPAKNSPPFTSTVERPWSQHPDVNFLQEMFKNQREKVAQLQMQRQEMQEKIVGLKRYKKDFKNYRARSLFVIEQAFLEQFFQQYLTTKMGQLQSKLKRTEKKLMKLLLKIKDMKEERDYNLSIRREFLNKPYNRSISAQEPKRLTQTPTSGDQNLQNNYSTISNRSRQRSVSGRKRKSQDKSLTKKSNNSHIMMKKEFTNIADNYERMLKEKNTEMEKLVIELKQAKLFIQTLEEDNSRVKAQLQQLEAQLSNNKNDMAISIVEAFDQANTSRRNSGNLRILSRNSSRSEMKKSPSVTTSPNLQEENEQLKQQIKRLQEEVNATARENSSLEQHLETIHMSYLNNEGNSKQLEEKVKQYEEGLVPKMKDRIKLLEENVEKLEQSGHKVTLEMGKELERLKTQLNEKDKRISELDSQLYLNSAEIKKLQNLLALKTAKLEEYNKLLLAPTSSSDPFNESFVSVTSESQNKSTLLMLQSLQKQLQQQKQDKQLQFIKLKKSYESKIQQLKIQLEEIVVENQKLADKVQSDQGEERKLQEEKEELVQNLEALKHQVEDLQQEMGQLHAEIEQTRKENAFLSDKIAFYQTQRQTKKTGSFAEVRHRRQNSHHSDQNLQNLIRRPNELVEEDDFVDFVEEEKHQLHNSNAQEQSKEKWKSGSGEIQLLDESSVGNNSVKRAPSEQNYLAEMKRINSQSALNHSMQQKLSVLKSENIELCQKLAKLQKQNKYLKQSQIERQSKHESLKSQLTNFTAKYEELQKHNSQLLKMIEQIEKEKKEFMKKITESQGTSPIDWKQVQRTIEPVELKGSGMYMPWNFAQKEDILLQKSRDYGGYNIRESIVSNCNVLSRPSRQSRESIKEKNNEQIEQLTKKLTETELMLQNKEKINEELMIAFTKKVDHLNTQIEQQSKEQSKALEKYIQENSLLRKEKEKLEEEVNSLRNQILLLEKRKDEKAEDIQNLELEERIGQEAMEEEQQGGLMEQRIEGGFMLGINEDEEEPQVSTSLKQQSKNDQPKELNSCHTPHFLRLPPVPPKQPKQFADQMLEQEEDLQFQDDFQEHEEKIELLSKQVKELQETIETMQKYLEETLNKMKQKEEEKAQLVEELQKKNIEVDELKDLIELKEIGQTHNLTLSKSINEGVHGQKSVNYANQADRSSVQKSERPRMNSVMSLKYSQTNHPFESKDRKSSFEDDLNFQFLDMNNTSNKSLEHSHLSAIYSENMSMIFDKEENFLQQIKKAKNKRKEEGRLLKKTFEYIRKLRTALNSKNKKIKLLEMRIDELKDNCWLWREDRKPNSAKKIKTQPFIEPQSMKSLEGEHQSIIDHNQSLSDNENKLVDSRLFECNSEDLNKKKPHRHNHYKKLEYDTKLIAEENRILTKQVELLQQELVKIEEQENGLMAVKQLYKEEIRQLTRKNQQLNSAYTQQIQKLQQKLENSESIHNFEAIKQLFKKIMDDVGMILHVQMVPEGKKKNINMFREEKKKEAQECIKVLCSILNYDESMKHELCLRIAGVQQKG